MSDEESTILNTFLARTEKLLSLGRGLGAVLFVIVSALLTGGIWVNNTRNDQTQNAARLARLETVIATAATVDQLRSLADDRKLALAEWSIWRVKKDENDTQLIGLVQAQQRFLDRQQQQLDRQQQQIDQALAAIRK